MCTLEKSTCGTKIPVYNIVFFVMEEVTATIDNEQVDTVDPDFAF